MKPVRSWIKVSVEQLLKEYEAGASFESLGKKYNGSGPTIAKILKADQRFTFRKRPYGSTNPEYLKGYDAGYHAGMRERLKGDKESI